MPRSKVFALIILIACIPFTICISQNATVDSYKKWILKTDKTIDLAQLKKSINDQSVKVEVLFEALNLYSLEYPDAVISSQIQEKIHKNGSYKWDIYPDRLIELRKSPNDPDYPTQWGLQNIKMPEVWDITTGGTAPNGDDIVVAIFDDGFDITHPDYEANIWKNVKEIPENGIDDDNNGYIDDYLGWNATENNDAHRLRTHGTAVAGIIGAVGDNGNQIAGVNWKVKLMLTSGGRNDGLFNISDIIKAYQYIYIQRKTYNETNGSEGAYVVVSNYSGGAPNLFPEDFPSWCEVYDLLGQEGVLNFTSAPNVDVDVDVDGDLPSTCTSDYLIVVTNTDQTNQKSQNAGFGSKSIDIGAPGEMIVTTAINGEVNQDFSGASASAPFVAGVASILYSVMCESGYNQSINDPSSIALTMRSVLLSNVTAVNSLAGITTSGGKLDALAAIKDLRTKKGIGDCCQITFNEIVSKDESCQDAADGQIIISLDTIDIRGPLSYSVESVTQTLRNMDGSFSFLEAEEYQILVLAERDATCKADTTINVLSSLDICAFGAFGISSIGPNPAIDYINVNYVLDELKYFEILIYDATGQLVSKKQISPSTGIGQERVALEGLAEGPYFLGIRSNDLIDAVGFVIIR
jgi:subtilisin family serine protease